MFRTIALTGFAALVAATTISLAPPAHAQIGNIFSDPPLRPPGAIPRGNQQQREQQLPDDDEEVPELPRGRLLPTPNRPPPGQGAPPPGSFQSQPLAPPPGTTVVPQDTQPGIAVQPPQPGQPGVAKRRPLPGLPPGQRQPKGVPQAPATLQPGDEVVSEPPAHQDHQQEGELLRASTRSPAASSISTRISARPCSSARCGSKPAPATRGRPPKPPTPTPLSRSTRSRCRAR